MTEHKLKILPDSDEQVIKCKKCERVLIVFTPPISLFCSIMCKCGDVVKYYVELDDDVNTKELDVKGNT